MKIKRIAHLGVAVDDLDSALKFFTDELCLDAERVEDFEDLRIGFVPVGESTIELIEDVSGSSTIRRFLDKNGEGIHHVAFEVDDIYQAVAELKQKGVRLVDETPRPGAHGMAVAFMHPKASHGILMELCQPVAEKH